MQARGAWTRTRTNFSPVLAANANNGTSSFATRFNSATLMSNSTTPSVSIKRFSTVPFSTIAESNPARLPFKTSITTTRSIRPTRWGITSTRHTTPLAATAIASLRHYANDSTCSLASLLNSLLLTPIHRNASSTRWRWLWRWWTTRSCT